MIYWPINSTLHNCNETSGCLTSLEMILVKYYIMLAVIENTFSKVFITIIFKIAPLSVK